MSTKTIEVKIEITGLSGWDVDWEDPSAVSLVLLRTKRDLYDLLPNGLGIEHRDLRIEVEIDPLQ